MFNNVSMSDAVSAANLGRGASQVAPPQVPFAPDRTPAATSVFGLQGFGAVQPPWEIPCNSRAAVVEMPTLLRDARQRFYDMVAR